ncbi:MAG: polysaccharide deacetylase family protein [Burkholderiales bacterium]|nr:polysaccharide deacetylase family protein [Burkholderiales bacterium]
MSRALVLMYHQVDLPLSHREARFCTPPQAFAAQMRWLVERGYRSATLDDIHDHVTGVRTLPERSVHITFDDGFVGVLEHALPVLAEHRLAASLFMVAGRMGDTNDWMHTRGYPRRALLSPAQLRLLAAEGVTIGSHTSTHVRLPEVEPQRAQIEIRDSKCRLEDTLGSEVRHFAYPYGAFDAQARAWVAAAGYRSACSTRSGFNRPGEDPYTIRRIDVYGTDRLWQFAQKLTFGHNDATRLYPLHYYTQRLRQRLTGG